MVYACSGVRCRMLALLLHCEAFVRDTRIPLGVLCRRRSLKVQAVFLGPTKKSRILRELVSVVTNKVRVTRLVPVIGRQWWKAIQPRPQLRMAVCTSNSFPCNDFAVPQSGLVILWGGMSATLVIIHGPPLDSGVPGFSGNQIRRHDYVLPIGRRINRRRLTEMCDLFHSLFEAILHVDCHLIRRDGLVLQKIGTPQTCI